MELFSWFYESSGHQEIISQSQLVFSLSTVIFVELIEFTLECICAYFQGQSQSHTNLSYFLETTHSEISPSLFVPI
jgi:hypothetical protein